MLHFLLVPAMLAMLLISGSALAEDPLVSHYRDERGLHALCESHDPDNAVLCQQYVLGIQDAVAAIRTAGFLSADQAAYCIPSGTKWVDVTNAVVAYIKNNPLPPPPVPDVNAAITVTVAMIKAFPCTKP